MKAILSIIALLLLLLNCSDLGKSNKNMAEKQLVAFELSDVELIEGPFQHAMEMDKAWLLSFEPDRFLSGFRLESGLKPKAPKYGGWESQGVAGQTFGHYLSALSMMHASTSDEELNKRIKYSINELDSCQQAFNFHGIVAGFPRAKELFREISEGDIRTEGFDLNGSWVPLYTMHKLQAGLIDVFRLTGNQQAYRILIGLSEGLHYVFAHLTDEQIQKILICEHGGINESMAEVYAMTGNEKYLNLSQRLNHKAVLEPLSQGKDELAGKHANTQIPKVLGAMRQYELTGDTMLLRTANFFWNTVVHQHSYVIGGNSEAEHFGVPGRTYDRITDKTCENCNTYNMLKLTKHLFARHPSVEKSDYYERALYNQILASQNPQDGMVCYMSPLGTGSKRGYSTPFHSFWCCVGTGLENHARYGEFIYFTNRRNEELYVNLFIPSILNWKEKKVKLIQKTRFPESDTIRFVVSLTSKQRFTLNLRYPSWAVDGYTLWVNNEKISSYVSAGNYIPIKRTWNNGDEVCYVLPKRIHSEPALGNENLRAYLYGPIVLAGLLSDTASNYPVVVSDWKYVERNIEKQNNALDFTLTAAQPYTIPMLPYYQTEGHKMIVYFEHYTKEQWDKEKYVILGKQNQEQWMNKQTVSLFSPGEMQPERDHNFRGEHIEVGQQNGRKFRKASNGGWFSFDMDVIPDVPQDVICTYWGNLGDIHKFEVLVDGHSIATVIIHWWGNRFVDKVYHIPTHITQDKKKVTITLKALDNKCVAGPLFNCSIVKRS